MRHLTHCGVDDAPHRILADREWGLVAGGEGRMTRAVRAGVVASALFAFMLAGFGPAWAQPSAPPQDPLAGSRVFGARGCVKCHAVNGIGGRIGPDLGRVARARSFYDLATAMWNHLPRMADRM